MELSGALFAFQIGKLSVDGSLKFSLSGVKIEMDFIVILIGESLRAPRLGEIQ